MSKSSSARWLLLGQIGCLTGFFFLTALVVWHGKQPFGFDVAVSQTVQMVSFPGLEMGMQAISLPGNYILGACFLVLMGMIVLARLGQPIAVRALLFSAGLGYSLNTVVKLVMLRPRPTSVQVRTLVHEASTSFPSGHVMHYVTFYGFAAFLACRLLPPSKLRSFLVSFFVLLVVTVGFSRIFLGAHWVSDVVAGYFFGAFWLLVSMACYDRWNKVDSLSVSHPNTNITLQSEQSSVNM